ncbi:MAG: hypothetical protein LBJ72_05990 [Dysgonamonadaceae bacterium]|nr:hypothetical protein [Dysgonamonadaceae bacterium]
MFANVSGKGCRKRYPYRQRSPAFQAESRWLSYLPQAALRLPAVMEIAPSGLKLSGIELMTHNPNLKLKT